MRLPRLGLLLTLLAAITPGARAQTQYEQVLVPFDSATLATGGARWFAELWVRNDGPEPVNLFPGECFFIGLETPCTRRIDVPAGRTVLLDLQEDRADRPGVFLYVPRDRLDDVHFSLRVRDLSRGGDQIGTEIPVVRQSEIRNGVRTLLNVPLQLNGRLTLRLYTPEAPGAQFIVRVFAEPTGDLIAQRTFQHGGATDPPSPAVAPLTIDASSIFQGWVADRVRVTIESTRPYWPLLTITNVRNKQITTVTPH
ncbi:MAG TPA: hypothetical protein VNA04_09470 [Thermoanaerobaculia bacterium]|nr:hypothetical protein [Thermoanaerobaculia bacterium]